ncbi:MAG: hypothetical protein WCS65_13320, partial [Verrucomicrobiae bacterium]
MDASSAARPFLFLEMDEQEDSRTGASTGERLHDQHPDVYQRVVAMLGQGAAVREIKRQLGVHHRTIRAVAIREGQTIDTMRRELGARSLGVAGLALEALEDRIIGGSVKPAELSMAIGILVDKGQLLTGGATGRVEKIERHQVEREIDAMLVEVETIEAEIITDTGLSGQNLLPIEPLPDGGSPGYAAGTDGSASDHGSGVSDYVSDVSGALPMADAFRATGSATDSLAGSAAEQ